MKTRLLLITVLAMFVAHTSSGQNQAKEHRIVFHLATGDTLVHKSLVKQLSNVLEYWPSARLEVVVHNNGISFMKSDEAVAAKEIAQLQSRGVDFAVCENTMKQRKLEKSQILPKAVFVPVAIAELTLKQEEGWAYIKAGF